jgi:hypothetical protein
VTIEAIVVLVIGHFNAAAICLICRRHNLDRKIIGLNTDLSDWDDEYINVCRGAKVHIACDIGKQMDHVSNLLALQLGACGIPQEDVGLWLPDTDNWVDTMLGYSNE